MGFQNVGRCCAHGTRHKDAGLSVYAGELANGANRSVRAFTAINPALWGDPDAGRMFLARRQSSDKCRHCVRRIYISTFFSSFSLTIRQCRLSLSKCVTHPVSQRSRVALSSAHASTARLHPNCVPCLAERLETTWPSTRTRLDLWPTHANTWH